MFQYVGRFKRKERWHPLIRTGRVQAPVPPPGKVCHDRSSKCIGCPYPAHGLMCHDNTFGGSCLRLDMQQMEARYLRELQKKKNAAKSLVVVDMAMVNALR